MNDNDKISESQLRDYDQAGVISAGQIIKMGDGYVLAIKVTLRPHGLVVCSQPDMPHTWASVDKLLAYISTVAPSIRHITMLLDPIDVQIPKSSHTPTCPHCEHEHEDDWEVLLPDQMGSMRCEACRQEFAFAIVECHQCGNEQAFSWTHTPSADALDLLTCEACGSICRRPSSDDQIPIDHETA
jgi:transcription elongation factor Elf1